MILLLYISITCVFAFIPSPLIKFAGRASNSITHQGITKKGFARAIHNFLKDIDPNKFANDNNATPSLGSLLSRYYADSDDRNIIENICAVFSSLDILIRNNALQDIRVKTRHDPIVHFDSEKIHDANKRLINGRLKILEAVHQNRFNKARVLLGGLLHTLQDFYSHTNWIELGNNKPLYNLGMSENIGTVADEKENTCKNSGCEVKYKKCDLIQRMLYRKCPLVYYSCISNLDENIQNAKKLTSGYVSTVNFKTCKRIKNPKPEGYTKCSHGGIIDASANFDAIGGINKDTGDEIYSPHYYLHKEAAVVAVLATEHFLTSLRKEMGSRKFANLIFLKLKPQHRRETNVNDVCRKRGNDNRHNSKKILKCLKLTENFWDITMNLNDIKFDSIEEPFEGMFINSVKSIVNGIKNIFLMAFAPLFSIKSFEVNVDDDDDEDLVINDDIKKETISDIPSVHCGTSNIENLIFTKLKRSDKSERNTKQNKDESSGSESSSIVEL